MTGKLGRRLFTFATVSDSHVNEAEDRSASPYASNRLANARFRFAVAAMRGDAPAFVVHLGDLGNPLPELGTYDAAAENFKALTAGLGTPLHVVPGNHCVGDKARGWVPVPRVSQQSRERWRRHFGADWWAFDHGPCRFVGFDSLLLDSGLGAEAAQREWLEAEMGGAAAAGQRLFVFMHYPAYVADPAEPASYDNLDPPARQWLLELLSRHGVEAAFSGHVHNFFRNRSGRTDLYTLPAVSFVRHDYSELFPVAPADGEGGRDDRAKLGYGLVDVHEAGHALRIVRTGGAVLAPGAASERVRTLAAVTRRQRAHPGAGVEMRDNWLAPVALRANNSVSPFRRRWARNDWALLALEETGLSRIRVALEELSEPGAPARMATMRDDGYAFVAYAYGVPDAHGLELVAAHRDLFGGLELIAREDELAAAAAAIGPLCGARGAPGSLPCFWSEVRDVERAQIDDANVKHVANYGFQPDELDRAVGQWRSCPGDLVSGLVFRLRRRGAPEMPTWDAVQAIARLAVEHGMTLQIHVLLSGNVTAEPFEDDLATANRVAEATVAAAAAGPGVEVYFDTFEDIDRGYFVRHGLVDRRSNPRLAARVLGCLNAALHQWEAGADDRGSEWRVATLEAARLIARTRGRRWLALVLPRPGCRLSEVPVDWPADGTARRPAMTLVKLDTGEVSEVSTRREGEHLLLEPPVELAGPALLRG